MPLSRASTRGRYSRIVGVTLGLGATGIGGLRRRCGLEGKLECRHGLLGVPLDGEDTFASRHLPEVVG